MSLRMHATRAATLGSRPKARILMEASTEAGDSQTLTRRHSAHQEVRVDVSDMSI